MPLDDSTRATNPDWGAIERGSKEEIANTLSLLYLLLTHEIAIREARDRRASSLDRQNRLAMMALYT